MIHERMATRWRSGGDAHQRGVVIVIMLLALVLLAAMLFYVMNLGRQTQQRIEAQNAADATAAAGAGWVARTFNMVAMHNVEMTRMIALVNVLDAMPLGVESALHDQEAVQEAVTRQLASGVEGDWVEAGLTDFSVAIDEEVRQLSAVDELLNGGGYDVREMTHYDGPGGRGRIWRAMEAMAAYSRSAMETLDELPRVNAAAGGLVNLPEGEATAMLVPPAVGVPWREGDFDDFERPMRDGLLPEAVDDPLTRRGPFDTIFGWRDPVYRSRTWSDPTSSQVSGGGQPGAPIGRGPVQGPRHLLSEEVEAYRVYGPLSRMLRSLGGRVRDDMPNSRLAHYHYAPFSSSQAWVNRIAHIKQRYLWPGGSPQQIVTPRWEAINDFERAAAMAEADASDIHETAFIAVEVKSTTPNVGGGEWAYIEEDRPRRHSPRIVWVAGWNDPREWDNSVRRLGENVWRDEWSYQVYFDFDLGLLPIYDENGVMQPQTVYRVDDYIFVGVNTGSPTTIRNPHNFASRENLPGPIDFDHDAIGPGEAMRRGKLTYLGVAGVDNDALLWAERFDGDRQHPRHVAVAQSTVFNNHSFDLWTQMWHAQNEAVDDYEGWLAQMEAMGDLLPPNLAEQERAAAELREQLRHVSPLAPLLMSH